jgi:phosphoadenosine phosphosulfate reductase
MYQIEFEENSNIPLLSSNIKNDDAISLLRPVFHEELDLLGFSKFWTYPRQEAPLLWANGRRYFYKGELVAQVNGGDIYNPPELDIIHNGELEPINLDELISKNLEKLILIENEAKLFVYNVYKKKVTSLITVSFSGGKDSQVILDIASQVIPPDKFSVIYNDTGMELPYIKSSVLSTIENYKRLGKTLKFVQCNPAQDTKKLWELFGPPSRTHRWCCTVCKTAPFASYLRTLSTAGSLILNIAGIRAEESTARSKYSRINIAGKHLGISSIHPIFCWTSFEVYLYLFYKKIEINIGYRIGLSRVGCSICPFSSPISEYINYQLYSQEMQPFLQIIDESLRKNDIGSDEIHNYFIKKDWARIIRHESIVEFEGKYTLQLKENDCLIKTNIVLEKIKYGFAIFENFRFFVRDSVSYMEFIFRERTILVDITEEKQSFILVFHNIENDISLVSVIKKVFNKLIYCVGCRACEVECPQNALSVSKRSVEVDKCTHCLNCINKFDNGCLNANYRTNLKGDSKMNNLGALNRYWGFGLRNDWLQSFIDNPTEWIKNNSLGEIQFKAVQNWLKDGGFLINNNSVSAIVNTLKAKASIEQIIIILWINLCYESTICRWFISLDNGYYSKKDLENLLGDSFPDITERSRKNALSSLLGTLKATSLCSYYELCDIEMHGKVIVSITKKSPINIDVESILYATYKYGEESAGYNFTLNQLLQSDSSLTPFKLIGITKTRLEKVLVSLQENKNRLIRVEFNANLDNVFLNKGYSAIEALEEYLGGN